MRCAALLAFTMGAAFPAFPWGQTGHFTICEIAYRRLAPEVKAQVDELLDGAVFAEQCIWADKIRSSQKHTAPWHYVNLEDHESYPETINPAGDAVQALIHMEDALRDSSLDKADKALRLKFFIHFVGDLHQPLHVGRASDRGATTVWVSWYGKTHYTPAPEELPDEVQKQAARIHLHMVWDTLIAEKFVELELKKEKEVPAYKAYADKIEKASPKEIAAWQKAVYLDWMAESRLLRDKAYETGSGKLGRAYYNAHIDTVNSRLRMAGYRLAGALNRIFKQVPLTKPEREMRERLKRALNGQPTATR